MKSKYIDTLTLIAALSGGGKRRNKKQLNNLKASDGCKMIINFISDSQPSDAFCSCEI